ncbi:MAG: TonB-dependent receptor [Agarilytica sp.]
MPRVNFVVNTALFLVSVVCFADTSLDDASFHYDIPVQSLERALIEFGIQSKINLVISVEKISSYTSLPLNGLYSMDDGLTRILANSPFIYQYKTHSNTVIISVLKDRDRDDSRLSPSVSDREIEEVSVVSARHFNEALFDVPISMTSHQGDVLESSGVSDLIQLGSYGVNTTIKLIGGTNAAVTAFIRGIGQEDPLAGIETGVGIYIDDVYVNRPHSAILDIYDVERIEILRGPQGTLYGHNTIGGALKYVTKSLAPEPRLDLKVSYGSFNQTDILMSGHHPIVENTLTFGGSAAIFSRDGFGKNITTNEPEYDKRVISLRSSLEYSPNDYLFIRISGDSTRNDSSTISGSPPSNNSRPIGVYDSYAGITARRHPLNKAESYVRGFSLTAEYYPDSAWQVYSISAYRGDRTQLPVDIDGSPMSIQDLFILYENEQVSQEFRLMFDGETIRSVMGVYYLDANSIATSDVTSEIFGGLLMTRGDVDKNNWAIFSSLDLAVTDTWSVSLGARYTKDKREADIELRAYLASPEGEFISPIFGGEGVIALGPASNEDGEVILPRFVGSLSDKVFTPRLSLSWKPNHSTHAFVSYAAGYKSGGFDPRGHYVASSVSDGFLPEKISTYELGLKINFWETSGSLNSVIFYSDYRNKQVYGSTELTLDVGGGALPISVTSIENSPKAVISGAEFELSFQTFEAAYTEISLGLIEAEFIDDITAVEGRVFQDTPKTTFTVSQRFETALFNGVFSMSGRVSYRSRVYLLYFSDPYIDQPGYSLVNASATWVSSSERWELGLHGANLWDKVYRVASFNFSEGLSSLYYGAPRTITASIKCRL